MIQVKVTQHCCEDLENEPFDRYEGKILLEGAFPDKTIGTFYAKLWHSDQVEDLHYWADTDSDDAVLIVDTLRTVLKNWDGKLLIIEAVHLEPEYRGKGYAREALKQFTRQFGYTITALKAFPLQWKENVNDATRKAFNKDLRKLKQVYTDWGLKHVKYDVMYSHLGVR